ncbi:MAG: MFS transporter [Clostridia bacterium]|nr:MFS transporter [Clostridia bacterium]
MKKGFLKEKFSYGIGAVGLDLSYGMFYSYLAKYMTDVLKLNKVFLLLITPLARIWDGINDPMMGTIVDNTKTKFGKYRPWVIIGSCCNAVVLALLFTNPGLKIGGIPLHIYTAILYVFWGMTNTMADIPYWSMVPSFTSDPNERNIIATIARAFSGLGQGIISILTPVVLPLLSVTFDPNTGEKVWDARGFSIWAIICALCLVGFSTLSMTTTKEKHIVPPTKEKFTFKKMFSIAKSNDQLLVFMLFAMLSNAGWYMISGVGAYYFDIVIGDPDKQSLFNTIGAVGSVLGLLVVPVMTKFTTRRRTYQFSLLMAIIGFSGTMAFASFFNEPKLMAMNLSYLVASIGVASMFVSQTVFLADIVDYGHVKQGFRSESITFSMKGFLQKMAYTVQTIILFSGLEISKYDETLHAANSVPVKNTISFMMLGIPIILFILSFIVFTFKFKLHGKYMEEITSKINEMKED